MQRGNRLLLYVTDFKRTKNIIFETNSQLNRVTAHFTVFNIRLHPYRLIQQHGYLFPTIRTLKEVFEHKKVLLEFDI
jgi:hypothetical protein